MRTDSQHADHLRTTAVEFALDEDEIPYTDFHHKLGLLYFIRSGITGPIKIGRTSNFPSRLKMLQTGSPTPLRVMATLEMQGWQEMIWHRAFAHCRIGGEWFDPTDDLLAAIDHAAEGHWDWPRAYESDHTEYLLDLVDIVGEFMVCGDVHSGEDLKRAFQHAEKDHAQFASFGLYDERFPAMVQALIDYDLAKATGNPHG